MLSEIAIPPSAHPLTLLSASELCGLWEVLGQTGLPVNQSWQEWLWLLGMQTLAQRGDTVYWDALCASDDLDSYQRQLEQLAGHANPHIRAAYRGARSQLKESQTLRALREALHQPAWQELAQTGLQQLLEQLYLHCPRAPVGLYSPLPDALITLLVALLQPQTGERILELGNPCAEFATALSEYFLVLNSDGGETQTASLHSAALDAEQQRLLALSHFLLAPQTPDCLQLSCELSEAPADFEVLFCNAFTQGEQVNLAQQLALLEQARQNLAPGGRGVIVLADDVLSAPQARAARQALLADCELHTLLRLPNGLFYGDTRAAHALFFSVGQTTQQTWCYDLRSPLPWFDPQDVPFTSEWLQRFQRAYADGAPRKRRDEGDNGCFRCFSRTQLSAWEDDLDILWLD